MGGTGEMDIFDFDLNSIGKHLPALKQICKEEGVRWSDFLCVIGQIMREANERAGLSRPGGKGKRK
jgi:hypothetical protein